jgi:hypothetical protein
MWKLFRPLRNIWKAGCLETCMSGLGLGRGCNSPAHTTWRATARATRPDAANCILPSTAVCEVPWVARDRAGRHITPVISRDLGRPIPAAGNPGCRLEILDRQRVGSIMRNWMRREYPADPVGILPATVLVIGRSG